MADSPPDLALPEDLPVLPLRELVVFPYMTLPLFVARGASVAAVEDALAADRVVLLVAQRDGETRDPEPDDLYRIGTAALILRSMRMPDGRLKVLVQGLCRARIESFIDSAPNLWARTAQLAGDSEMDWSVEGEALTRAVRGRVEELLPLKNLPPEVLSIIANVEKPGRLADLVASNLRLRVSEAQEVLEVQDSLARLRRVDALLRRELDVTCMQAEIQCQAKEEMSRGQREAYLREQLRAIQGELGDSDPRADEVDEYRLKIEDVNLPSDSREEALRQLRRLERMHPDGPEAQVVRNYLDWMVELPWNRTSPDRLDLVNARAILDEDHAHLEGVKDRILEFLGVRKLRADSRGPILCFAGPPGVGKTSLGRSIARAMGREFVRDLPRRRPRRGRDPRSPPHVRGGAPGSHHPGHEAGRHQQSGLHARRDRQDRGGLPRRSLGGAAGGARSRAERLVQRPLPERALRSLAGPLHRDRQPARSDPRPPARSHGGDPALGLHAGGEDADRHEVPDPAPARGARARRRRDLVVAQTPYRRSPASTPTKPGCAISSARSPRCAARSRAGPPRATARSVAVTQRTLAAYLGTPRYLAEPLRDESEVGVVNGLAWTEAGGDVLLLEATLTRGSRAGAHRTARRRHEGVGPGRALLRACARCARCGSTTRHSPATRSTSTCRPAPSRRTGRRRG